MATALAPFPFWSETFVCLVHFLFVLFGSDLEVLGQFVGWFYNVL